MDPAAAAAAGRFHALVDGALLAGSVEGATRHIPG